MKKNKIVGLIAGIASSALVLTGCGSVETSETSSASGGGAGTSSSEWQAPEGLTGEISYYSANPQGLTDALVEEFEQKTGVKVNVCLLYTSDAADE